jgi:hypothetical protein
MNHMKKSPILVSQKLHRPNDFLFTTWGLFSSTGSNFVGESKERWHKPKALDPFSLGMRQSNSWEEKRDQPVTKNKTLSTQWRKQKYH